VIELGGWLVYGYKNFFGDVLAYELVKHTFYLVRLFVNWDEDTNIQRCSSIAAISHLFYYQKAF
jgi:hypothetical protein